MTPNDAIHWLHLLGCSCVVLGGNRLEIHRRRGVADLLELLENTPELLSNSFIADKVVGKGAAALMILGGAAGIYADVMSRPALQLIETAGIPATYGTLAENIINRSGTGICPVENLCANLRTPTECLEPIKRFVKKQQNPE